MKQVLTNPGTCHRESAAGGRGDLSSCGNLMYEIATLSSFARNDGQRDYFNKSMKRAAIVLLLLGCVNSQRVAGEERGLPEGIVDTLILSGGINQTLTPNIPFTEQSLSWLCDSLLAPWQDRGHYYATITWRDIKRKNNRVKIRAEVVPGPKVRIGRLLFRGLERSDPATLRHFFPPVTDSLLTARKLESVAEAARRISYLHFTMPVQVNMLEGYTSADIECDFREVRPFTVTAGGGYIPDDPTGLVWHLDLRLSNLLGQGRRATLLSQRRERGRKNLRLGYSQPVFWFGPGRIEFGAATRDYRDSFYEFSLRGAYRLDRWLKTSSSIALAYRSVEPVGQRPSFSVYSVEHSIRRRSLDDDFSPSRGLDLNWSLLYSYRRHETDSAAGSVRVFNETRIAVEVAAYRPLVGPLVGHIGIRYRGLETDEDLPPLSELFLVGGPRSLRGYRNEQFVAIRTAMVTLEPRLRFDGGYLFGFADGAYINNRSTDDNEVARTDEDFHWGFGIGLAVRSSTTAVVLSLGWKPDSPFDQARLSVELTSEI